VLGTNLVRPADLPNISQQQQRGGPWFTRLDIALLAIVALAVALWLPRLRGPVDLRYDAGVYFLLGQSLQQGSGYRILSEPGHPEAVQYPPGVPLLVALTQIVSGADSWAQCSRVLRKVYCGMFVIFGVLSLLVARRFLSPVLAFAAASVCMLQINTVLMSDLLFSELPFTLSLLGFILALRSARLNRRPVVREAATFALASAAFALRTAGLAVLAAWCVEALLRRAWRTALLRAALAALPVLGWQAHVMRVQGSEEYRSPAYAYQRAAYQFYNVTYAENLRLLDPFRPEEGWARPADVARRFVDNLRVIPRSLGEAVSSTRGFWKWRMAEWQGHSEIDEIPGRWVNLPLVMLSVGVLAGLGWWVRRHAWAEVAIVVLSIALVCATPWPGQFARYLTPIAPLLAAALFSGVTLLWRLCLPFPLKIGLRATVVALLAISVSTQVFAVDRAFSRRSEPPFQHVPNQGSFPVFYYDEAWANWAAAVRWLAANGQPGVVATSSPHLCYIWTAREAIFPPFEADTNKAQQLVDSASVKYLIVDELEFLDVARVYGAPLVEKQRNSWREVFAAGETRIYERQ
jgi:hypothetical protein